MKNGNEIFVTIIAGTLVFLLLVGFIIRLMFYISFLKRKSVDDGLIYNKSREALLKKKEPTQEEIFDALDLLGKNLPLINERFGSMKDCYFWMQNCTAPDMATIINDFIDGFNRKENAEAKK